MLKWIKNALGFNSGEVVADCSSFTSDLFIVAINADIVSSCKQQQRQLKQRKMITRDKLGIIKQQAAAQLEHLKKSYREWVDNCNLAALYSA